jgi:hypothetical protein
MKTKLLTVRIPVTFHSALVAYCEEQFIPMSSLVMQLLAKEIGYKPQRDTPRSSVPVVQQYWDGTKFVPNAVQLPPEVVEDGGAVDFTEEELADLQRRAALADVKPM